MIESLTALLYRRLYAAAEAEAQRRIEEKDYGMHPITRGIIDAAALATLLFVGASWALAKAANAISPIVPTIVIVQAPFTIPAPTILPQLQKEPLSPKDPSSGSTPAPTAQSFIYANFYRQTQGWHGDSLPGRDYAAGCETPILTPITGTVIQNGYDGYCGPHGCNNSVLVIEGRHYRVTLLHGKYSVEIDSQVAAGDIVGVEASIGNSSGCHSHLSVWDVATGRWIDPTILE